MRPISLTDAQLNRVITAAALLPNNKRSPFLRSVAARLIYVPNVEQTIRFVLAVYGVTGGRKFIRTAQM